VEDKKGAESGGLRLMTTDLPCLREDPVKFASAETCDSQPLYCLT